MHPLQEILAKSPKLTIGLMSGTSIDSVDAALVEIAHHGPDTELKLIGFCNESYPGGVKEKILECSTPGNGTVDDICRLNVLIGEVFAEAALSVVKATDTPIEKVDLIGSHGQTVHHLPQEHRYFGRRIRSTLQLGEPAVISKRTGIVTVADFRPADMGVNGQGAPLVPYLDYLLFQDAQKNRVLLNVGGIANLTLLKPNCSLDEVVAYDCGPGNMVIDAVMSDLYGQAYDEEGRIARSGTVSPELLRLCLDRPYFQMKAPKSTGREEFGRSFVRGVLAEATSLNLPPQDVVATVTQLTVDSIWESYIAVKSQQNLPDELIVSGGGAKNIYLMDSLRGRFRGTKVVTIDEYGIPAEAKEAVCFALLANETIHGHNNNVPSATGAKCATVMGKICF